MGVSRILYTTETDTYDVTVWIAYQEDGSLRFHGQHFDPGHAPLDRAVYEYFIVIPQRQFVQVRKALMTVGAVDVAELMQANAETICDQGELTWLDRHGIEYTFEDWHNLA